MAHIMSHNECEKLYGSQSCPFPNCPDDLDCLKCHNHCPCCSGCTDNLCSQCSEDDCSNRTAPYQPDSSQKED